MCACVPCIDGALTMYQTLYWVFYVVFSLKHQKIQKVIVISLNLLINKQAFSQSFSQRQKLEVGVKDLTIFSKSLTTNSVRASKCS